MRTSTIGFARRAVAGVCLALLLAACQTTGGDDAARSALPCGDRTIGEAVPGAGLCLAVQTRGVENAGAAPTLVVMLHGDVSRGGPADYMIPFAEEIGAREGVVAVAMIRPGYSDGLGGRSTGSTNNRRDHYTDGNNRAVAEAVQALSAHYGAARTVVLGHSGGAAQVGAAIGRFPDLADAALLVSCPCDVPRWRSMRGRSAWTRSQSPDDFVETVPDAMAVIAVTGGRDDNTSPVLAQDYVAALRARGIDAAFVEAPGRGHGFNGLWPSVRRELDRLIAVPATG